MRRHRRPVAVVASDSESDSSASDARAAPLPTSGARGAPAPALPLGTPRSCASSTTVASPSWEERMTWSALRRCEVAETAGDGNGDRGSASSASLSPGRWAAGLDALLPSIDIPPSPEQTAPHSTDHGRPEAGGDAAYSLLSPASRFAEKYALQLPPPVRVSPEAAGVGADGDHGACPAMDHAEQGEGGGGTRHSGSESSAMGDDDLDARVDAALRMCDGLSSVSAPTPATMRERVHGSREGAARSSTALSSGVCGGVCDTDDMAAVDAAIAMLGAAVATPQRRGEGGGCEVSAPAPAPAEEHTAAVVPSPPAMGSAVVGGVDASAGGGPSPGSPPAASAATPPHAPSPAASGRRRGHGSTRGVGCAVEAPSPTGTAAADPADPTGSLARAASGEVEPEDVPRPHAKKKRAGRGKATATRDPKEPKKNSTKRKTGTAGAAEGNGGSGGADDGDDGGDFLKALARRYLGEEADADADAGVVGNAREPSMPCDAAPPSVGGGGAGATGGGAADDCFVMDGIDLTQCSFLAWRRQGGDPEVYLQAVRDAETAKAGKQRGGRKRERGGAAKKKDAATNATVKAAEEPTKRPTAGKGGGRGKAKAAPASVHSDAVEPAAKRTKKAAKAAAPLAAIDPNTVPLTTQASRWQGKRGGGKAGKALRKLAKNAFTNDSDSDYDPAKALAQLENEATAHEGAQAAVWADVNYASMLEAKEAEAETVDVENLTAAYEEPRLPCTTRVERAVKTRMRREGLDEPAQDLPAMGEEVMA